jgi:hypothetical protein
VTLSNEPMRKNSSCPQTLSEVMDVVQREKLDVEVDVGMHLGPTPWKEIERTVAAISASGQKTDAGKQ